MILINEFGNEYALNEEWHIEYYKIQSKEISDNMLSW